MVGIGASVSDAAAAGGSSFSRLDELDDVVGLGYVIPLPKSALIEDNVA